MTDAPQWQFGGSHRDKYHRRASRISFIWSILAVMIAVGIWAVFTNRDYSAESLNERLNAAEPPPKLDSTIIPGFGIKDFHIGMPEKVVEQFASTFKEPIYKDAADDQSNVWNFNMLGIDCYTKDGRTTGLNFNYRQRSFVSYDGVTDKGIGMWSTVGDVLRAYGPPNSEQTSGVAAERQKTDSSGRRVITSFSGESVPRPPPPRYRMFYPKRGLSFGFVNGELQYVFIMPPTQ